MTLPAPTVTGGHSNDAFCKIILVEQIELFGQMARLDPISPDMTKRAKYFSDSKVLNAKLVKTAPAGLASDVTLQTKNSDAMLDAQLANDNARISATAHVLSGPANLAATKHISDYCGMALSP